MGRMKDSVKMELVYVADSEEECMKVGTSIHKQLVGNQDYIDNNILLNCTEGDNIVRLYVFRECENIPKITI